MTADRLWSPQMRKWAKDARKHGVHLHFETQGKPKLSGAGQFSPLFPYSTEDTVFFYCNSGDFNDFYVWQISDVTGPTPPSGLGRARQVTPITRRTTLIFGA